MKKLFLLIIILLISAGLLYWVYVAFFEKEPLCFAVVGPLSEPKGEMMLNGITLCADKLNDQGGINGKKIKLITYDDKDNPKLANDIAVEIAQKNEALLVFGHFSGHTCLAAGKTYKRNEIPAITASAVLSSVTYDNEWYFRSLPENLFEGEFIANHVYRNMDKKSASIVFTDDILGSSMADIFEKSAKTIGMEIIKKCKWNPNDTDRQLGTILNELTSGDKPEILFFATTKTEGAMIVVALKDNGITMPIIGSNAFGNNLLEDIKAIPMKTHDISYYTNGIYYIVNFIKENGNPEAFQIAREFYDKYGKEITASFGCYYDAMLVASEAVKKISIQGRGHIREDRRNIRDALVSFYSNETAVKGITSDIYFDEDRQVKRPPAIVVFQDEKVIPAYSQYIQTPSYPNDVLERILIGKIFETRGVLMNNIRIIFANVNNIEIKDVNLKDKTCSVSFQVKFRYLGDFDISKLEFTDSIKPVKLENPISEEKKDGITTQIYNVQTELRTNFDLHLYPFGDMLVPIRFIHLSSNIVFSPDVAIPVFYNNSICEWVSTGIELFPYMVTKDTTFGNPDFFKSKYTLKYCSFNAIVQIHDKLYPIKIGLIFLPVFIMLIGLYWILKKSTHYIKICMTVFIINFSIHLKLSSDLPLEYLTAMDFIFIAVYIAIACCLITNSWGYRYRN